MSEGKVIRRSVFDNLVKFFRTNPDIIETPESISWCSKEGALFVFSFVADKINGRYIYYVNLTRNDIEVPKILDLLIEEKGNSDLDDNND